MKGGREWVARRLQDLPVVPPEDDPWQAKERSFPFLYVRYSDMARQHGGSDSPQDGEFEIMLQRWFPEKDGMYFLEGQVYRYEAWKAAQRHDEAQSALFIEDEQDVVSWLRQQLREQPQTLDELALAYQQTVPPGVRDTVPPLRELIEVHFCQEEKSRCWRLPDPDNPEDFRQIRDRRLLPEFQTYARGKNKLKRFKVEVVRAGFKHSWRKGEYEKMARVGKRLPAVVFEEDEELSMYYDNALTRTGGNLF